MSTCYCELVEFADFWFCADLTLIHTFKERRNDDDFNNNDDDDGYDDEDDDDDDDDVGDEDDDNDDADMRDTTHQHQCEESVQCSGAKLLSPNSDCFEICASRC